MIRADDRNVPRQGRDVPWQGRDLDRAAVCVLWTTGPDSTIDGVFRMQALRRAGDGAWEAFDAFCDPFSRAAAPDGAAADEDVERDRAVQATARMVREFGVDGRDLAGRPDAREVWPALADFLGPGPVLVLDAEAFDGWAAHLARGRDGLPEAIGLREAAALFVPGRLANRRDELVAGLVDAPLLPSAAAFGPRELHAAWAELALRFHEHGDEALELFAAGCARAWQGLASADPRAAGRLALLLELFDRPSAWRPPPDGLAFRAPPPDGRLARAAATDLWVEQLLDRVEPRCAALADTWRLAPDMPPEAVDRDALPFEAEDLARLDEVFERRLPALFAREQDTPPRARASQHAVARATAEALGGGRLLLVHAPTGTGKTLAYLVPALLWAKRHGVRVGVATYTRALQEQAMDRDVPRALAALAHAGVPSGMRVSVLKGRENYVCWRAVRSALPADEDDGAAWLAWTQLVLFALTDPDGDLNRLPLRAPLASDAPRALTRALETLARQARAATGCCTHRDDRETCAAELARGRAGKSHVVLTNQAFALARQDFFKHVVFDECEHLHDQALNAWSHALPLRRVQGLLDRLHQEDAPQGRAPLDRLRRSVLDGTPTANDADLALAAWRGMTRALARLERAVLSFEAWRDAFARGRSDQDTHSLLREFCLDPDEAHELLEARAATVVSGNDLEQALAAIAERLAVPGTGLPLRDGPRLRRALEVGRADLMEVLAALEAWIPLKDGRPSFARETFHDVERNARGELLLVARVLLPNEYLGRNYHPALGTGVFLSATTFLEQSFEPALRYLGLDRAAHPDADEERPPREVTTFRAPEVFDYRRALVLVPRDAPSPRLGKDLNLDYVRRFLAHLGERTRGRMLVLFTNTQDVRRVGEELAGFFRARRIPFWWQGMPGTTKEELGEQFRAHVDSVLLGVDTFWFGADFPGETLEYLVMVRLPYGVPDRYHHAQCSVLGTGEQRKTIYRPRALAKFRQGFGRLMRRETDKGCVFVLDGRILEPQHRFFLRELPLERIDGLGSRRADEPDGQHGSRLVRGDTDHCVHEALAHMEMLTDVARRGLAWTFREGAGGARADEDEAQDGARDRSRIPTGADGPLDVPLDDVPY